MQSTEIETLGNYGATLSLIEVGLGSILHGLKIPFAGIFLSLNQGYLLCRVSMKSQEKWSAFTVSNIAAVLKSLSPAGQKLGPMLSLSMQGLLFNSGTLIFGINPVGLSIGMVLLSFWSFVQPIITYYLFFGEKLLNAAQFLYEKTLPYHKLSTVNVLWIFICIVMLKALIAIVLAIVAWKTKGKAFNQDGLIREIKYRPKLGSSLKLALLDLTRPLFVFSLIMTGVFLYFSQHEWAEIIWYLMRPLSLGFIFFYFSRTIVIDRLVDKLEKRNFKNFSNGCRIALAKLRRLI